MSFILFNKKFSFWLDSNKKYYFYLQQDQSNVKVWEKQFLFRRFVFSVLHPDVYLM